MPARTTRRRWRRDHLERACAHLASTGADLVYSWLASLLPDGTVVLLGVSPDGVYAPTITVPASAWVMKRRIAAQQPWRDGWTIRLPPSQDWLWRAWHGGARLVELPRLSVVALPSGARSGSYRADDPASGVSRPSDNEHQRWHDRILESDEWAEDLLTKYVQAQANGGRIPPARPALRQLSRVARHLGSAAIAATGRHPLAVLMAVRHPGRGGYLAWLRSERGLPARSETTQ
jgi:hypothetical protein